MESIGSNAMEKNEYEFIYKKSFVRELANIISYANLQLDDGVQNEINEIIGEVKKNAGIHLGHPYISAATMTGVYRMVLKRLAKKYNVEFPVKEEGEDEIVSPWWKKI